MGERNCDITYCSMVDETTQYAVDSLHIFDRGESTNHRVDLIGDKERRKVARSQGLSRDKLRCKSPELNQIGQCDCCAYVGSRHMAAGRSGG